MKLTYRNKIENVRLVRQKCAKCGSEFIVVYNFAEKGMLCFGKKCNCNVNFSPVDGPTFVEWYERQARLREAVKAIG